MLSLFIGIAYTGVLNYYGKIVGTVNVQGPIFYASNNCSGNVCKLYVNELPSQYSGEISNVSLIYFDTEKLDVNKWYTSVWKITLKIKPSSSDQRIDYTLKFADTSDKVICTGSIILSSLETTTITCKLTEVELTSSHYLELILSSKFYPFNIYVDGTTKIEVSKE